MTPAEIERLLEGLVGPITLTSLRRGDDPDRSPIGELEDDQYALLVRWLSGERFTAPEQPARLTPGPRMHEAPRRLVPVSDDELSFMDEEDSPQGGDDDEPRRPPGRKFDSPGITLL